LTYDVHRFATAGDPRLLAFAAVERSMLSALTVCLLALCLSGCSIDNASRKAASGFFTASAKSFASDDDLELVGDATPFALKMIDTLILNSPNDAALLLAGARGFSQFAFGFVQQKGELIEDKNTELALAQYQRAKQLYRRALSYGWRGLELDHLNLQVELHRNLPKGLKALGQKDVPFMYWTALSLGALINLSKDNAELIAQVPIVEGLMDRALELDEAYEAGAIHQFFIGYELNRRNRKGDPVQLSRNHFYRAVQLSQGRMAAYFVTLAETVTVKEQDVTEFENLLNTAIRISPDSVPNWRLANLLWQERARWLLARKDRLFTE
jgi:tetratricopeptide (TPR) repeat protein